MNIQREGRRGGGIDNVTMERRLARESHFDSLKLAILQLKFGIYLLQEKKYTEKQLSL